MIRCPASYSSGAKKFIILANSSSVLDEPVIKILAAHGMAQLRPLEGQAPDLPPKKGTFMCQFDMESLDFGRIPNKPASDDE